MKKITIGALYVVKFIVNTVEKLNTSQLRNLWLRSPDERLASWREFRIELQSSYGQYEANGSDEDDAVLVSSLESISTWWEQVPLVSVAIDPFNSDSWPNVWEIIYQGECCKYSRGLAMAYNMHYMDPNVYVTLDRVYDHHFNDEYTIANFGGKYALNSQHGKIIRPHEVDSLEIRESWDIQATLLNNQY